MPQATFQHADGTSQTLDVNAGSSLMQAATRADVQGIVGDCGGQMSCATCHVVVLDESFAASLPPPSDSENQMLDYTAMPREPHSRLSCQIVMTEALDGIRVRIADPQL